MAKIEPTLWRKQQLTLVDNSAPDSTPLTYALRYAALGWHVLPVWGVDDLGRCRCGKSGSAEGHKPGKHPHGKLAPHGHHDASADEAVIREWFTADPDAGVGLSLEASGLVALDVDPRNGGDAALAALEAEHGVLYSEVVAITQGGGEHRVFKADPQGVYESTLGAGLDVKHNGYICVEPTRAAEGVYRWAPGANPLQGRAPSEPPGVLVKGAAGRYSLTERGGVPVATAQTFEDLRSALEFISADEYDTWAKVGNVLKPYGEAGYAVWVEWSARSGKFSSGDARRKWDRDLTAPDVQTFRSVFYYALQNKWPGSAVKAHAQKRAVASLQAFVLEPLTLAEVQSAQLNPRVVLPYLLYADVRTRIAAGGVGKTTLALYEAVCLALGRELWGRAPERPMRTALVTREDARETLAARLREVMKALQLDPEAVGTVLANVLIMDLSAVSYRLSAVVGDVVLPHADNLEWLIKQLRGFRPDWLIMDPLVSFGVGEQRVNDAEQGLIEAMRILKKEFNCCVEGIHHSGKANAREKTLDQYSGRGGSALADGARMVCVLAPLTPKEWTEATGEALDAAESGMVMALPKMSYCRPQAELYIKRRGYAFVQVPALAAPAPGDVHRQIEATVYNALREAWLKNAPLTAQELKADYKALFYGQLKRDEVTDAVARLRRDGRVVQRDTRGGKGARAVLEPIIIGEAEKSQYSLPGEPGETRRDDFAG